MLTEDLGASRDRLIPAHEYDAGSDASVELEQLRPGRRRSANDQTVDHADELTSIKSSSDESRGRDPKKKSKGSHSSMPAWANPQKLHAQWHNGWLPEALSCCLSVAALVCLTTTLRYFEGYALNDIPLKISINALVAVFAAVIKSSLLLPVAEGMIVLKLQVSINNEM